MSCCKNIIGNVCIYDCKKSYRWAGKYCNRNNKTHGWTATLISPWKLTWELERLLYFRFHLNFMYVHTTLKSELCDGFLCRRRCWRPNLSACNNVSPWTCWAWSVTSYLHHRQARWPTSRPGASASRTPWHSWNTRRRGEALVTFVTSELWPLWNLIWSRLGEQLCSKDFHRLQCSILCSSFRLSIFFV